MSTPTRLAEVEACFDDGHFDLLAHHVWLWTDAVQGDHGAGVLSSVACLIAFNGAGVSIQGLMDHLQAAPHDVLFGEIVIDAEGMLAAGTRYRVTTKITDVERKQGRRIPLFDRVTIVQQIIDDATGALAATVTQIWVVTRGDRP